LPKVAFAVGGLYTEGSGVARIVCDLANALARRGTPVDVYTADCPGRGVAGSWLEPPNRLRAAPGRWCGRLAWSPALRRTLEHAIPDVDVVHNHSLWMLPTSYAARAALRHDIPCAFTMHGFLEPWALAHSRWKKRLAGRWFQDADLRRATCLHVNSESELAGVRAYGLRNPVAVIPNGVTPEAFDELPPRTALETRFPAVRGKRVCLFLSRLHEKKGLEHLVIAWARLQRDFPDWRLVVAGPDDGFEPQLRAAIDALGVDATVTLTGPLYGQDKRAAFAAADLFVLPSFSEGFSMAVLEAMAAGLPVLITPGCNFREAAERGAAVEATPDADGTEQGLRNLLGLDDRERRAMGARARELVEARYTWGAVSGRLLQLYGWLCSGGPRPDFVCH
jgi:glycosyltransferase involved in cell wall biosynthesis